MKRLLLCLSILTPYACAAAQTVNASQQVVLQGLRASAGKGSFRAAGYAADGSLVLLYDQGDGLRVLKANAAGTTVMAQAWLGTTGDSGIAMSLDPSGNIYVTGTTTSSTLSGTNGAAFPSRADGSINSFLAKFDPNLNLIFLTFLGSGRTAAASVAATADAVFVTGITFNASFPVTAAGIQQAPALNSSENGFVERFSANGSTLVYATYLTGANGDTVPTAIVADGAGNAYITGETSATGYPTISALQPTILGTNSGFLSKLTPAGDGFVYSTFLAGTGISSLALDASTSSLLLSGNIALGQLPVATVPMPLTSANYQTLLRVPLDGQSISSSVLLAAASQSFVSAGTNGDAWVSGVLTTPLLPGAVPPDYNAGDSFLLHLTSNNVLDQTLRFGGAVVKNPGYASLTSTVAAPAVSGSNVMLPGTVQTTVSASLLNTQHFDLPQVQAPNAGLLPSSVHDALPAAASCNSQCSGTAALLATVSTATSAPSLSLSTDNSPNLTLRNLGSAMATGLAINVTGFTFTTNCGTTLAPSSLCSVALTGTGPGSLTVSAANAAAATATLGANSLQPDALALSAAELDYGITTFAGPTSQTITITNLSATAQTFSSALDGVSSGASTFAESATDCTGGGGAGLHIVAANSSCHITISLTVSTSSTNDGPVRASWKIGTRDLVLTGFAQAAALNLSASEVDFGTHFATNGGSSGINLPRYLYLSNNSNVALSHAAASLPSGSAFAVNDRCPSVLEPHSVCQMLLTYAAASSPSHTATTLSLDNGAGVLLTGTTLPPASITGSSTNPSLSVSTTAVNFSTPVIVSGVSGSTQSVTIKNTGASSFALSAAISGDFTLTNGCPAQLAGGMSCTVLVGFTPTQPGARLGLLSLVAGSGFAPTYVSLSGTATAILPSNNGLLDLGETLLGEPAVAWYKIQQPLVSLSASTSGGVFGVALVNDTGSGHGTLPASDFSSSVTAACGNCWLGVQFLSQTAGMQAATLTLSTTNGGSPYTLTLTGTALPVQGLMLTPVTQDFGTVFVNSASAPISFTLANLLTSAVSATVQSITATGDFSITSNRTGGPSCTGALAATASCFVQVAFSPTATGERSGTLTVVTSAGTVTATLSGYGAADQGVAISPTELDFENVPGSSATQQSVILSNTGSSTLSIGSVTTSDPSFSVASGCGSLSPGSLCTLAVTFTPQTADLTATLSVPVTQTTNGQTSTTIYTVALNGGYTTADSGLQILPAEVNFGSTATGSMGGTRQFTINNLTSKTLTVALQMPRQFPLTQTAPCTTLAPGSSCNFSVAFLPVTNGPITGTVYAQGVSTDGTTTTEALTYMLGYGAGTGALEVNGLPIPYSPVSFGQVSSGQSAQHTLTLTNGGSGPLTIHRISSAPPFLTTNTCSMPLSTGASCSVTITYAPIYQIAGNAGTSAARSDSETLILESDAASSPDMVALSGLAAPAVTGNPANPTTLAAFSLTQSALTFTSTQLGSTSAPQTVTMTNTGTSTLHISSVVAPPDFSATTTCATLFAGASCTITASLAPTNVSASTVRSGALQIVSDAGNTLEFVSLIGVSSAASLSVSPTALDFGSVNVGSSASLNLTVSNTASTPVTLLNYAAGGDYSIVGGSCPAAGSTLAANSSCSLNVVFTPSAAGMRTGTLSLTSDATTLPLTVALSGTGVQLVAPTPSFVLTVNGGSTATMTVSSGSPAVFNLLLTPVNGFTGPVALTCTPVVTAAYANCSLLSSTLTLSGSALNSTATINTITTAAVRTGAGVAALLLGPMLFWQRRRGRWIATAFAATFAATMMSCLIVGCGSSSRAPTASNIEKTPAGTYQYQVTASSTSGAAVSSTVTLNLIVQ